MSNQIYNLKLFGVMTIDPAPGEKNPRFVTRVPGGWVFETTGENSQYNATFIPFNNEFMDSQQPPKHLEPKPKHSDPYIGDLFSVRILNVFKAHNIADPSDRISKLSGLSLYEIKGMRNLGHVSFNKIRSTLKKYKIPFVWKNSGNTPIMYGDHKKMGGDHE